jgi:hypothetical protein
MTIDCYSAIQELRVVDLVYDDICELLNSGRSCVVRAMISPETARRVMSFNNANNRPIRPRKVKSLKEQHAAGKFVYNGETITFGTDGNVLNGQHRLTMLAESEASIDVLLVFGVPVDVFASIDTGIPRSAGDVLACDGHTYWNCKAAVMRHLHAYEAGAMGSSGGNLKMTNADFLDSLERYGEAKVERSIVICGGFSRITRPALAAALHYLFASVDDAAADEFVEIVKDGISVGRRYSDRQMAEAASQLRATLTNFVMGSRRPLQTTVAGVWIKAWNGYRTGRVPKILTLKSTEPFQSVHGLELPLGQSQ